MDTCPHANVLASDSTVTNCSWPEIDRDVYQWSIALFRALKRVLGVNIKLHDPERVRHGDIFVFNHFSRFETFVPQFLIYEETGAFCWSIASSEFFAGDNMLSRFLKKTGVIRHDHPRLFPILATQILRGHKVIIFPEGHMVKDRRVMDHRGRLGVHWRGDGPGKKQHTGAAVLAQGLEMFKRRILNAGRYGDYGLLSRWVDELQMESVENLLAVAEKPTTIVPANITFYPLHSSENVLTEVASLLNQGLSPRHLDELIVEGNILLKETDMDLRMGRPIRTLWNSEGRLSRFGDVKGFDVKSLDELFSTLKFPRTPEQRGLQSRFRTVAESIRDRYMHEIYRNVTINLSHVASTVIHCLIERGQHSIERQHLYRAVYIAVKLLQQDVFIHLHQSLLNPKDYENLLDGRGEKLEMFLEAAETGELIRRDQSQIHFLPKLRQEYNFHTVRMENPIVVYSNEAVPVRQVRTVAEQALKEAGRISEQRLARWALDDERLAFERARRFYQDPRFDDINREETAEADPAPFLLKPVLPNGFGVLLVHGLLASPAELRGYGDYLCRKGYTVLGVRLAGHGTSPYDLEQRSFQDWTDSVHRGARILGAFAKRIFAIGFSTGGALALDLARDPDANVCGVVAAAVPVRFTNPVFMLVPLLHGGNTLLRWVPAVHGVKPFVINKSEHPQVNYRNVPVKSLYELRRLMAKVRREAPSMSVPTLLVHADQDPVVHRESSSILLAELGAKDKRLQVVSGERHGILMENIGGVWETIDGFLDELRDGAEPPSSLSRKRLSARR